VERHGGLVYFCPLCHVHNNGAQTLYAEKTKNRIDFVQEAVTMNHSEIKKALQDYFDGSYEGSGEKLAKVFHAAAHIYGIGEGGTLIDWPRDKFIERVESHKSEKPDFPRQDEILSIDFTGDNTAVVRVKLRLHKTLFTDMLCFVRLEGKWGIISKVFSAAPAE
jgi:hypothetical protein